MRDGRPGTGVSIRFVDIFWLLLGAVLASVFILLVAGVSYPSYGLLASELIFSAWILFGYGGIVGDRGWESLRIRLSPVSAMLLCVSAATGVGQILMFSLLTQLLNSSGVQINEPSPSPFGLNTVSVAELPFAILIAGILGPLAEEILFRGVLLDWLRQHTSTWLAVIVISIIFGLLHGNDFKLGLIGWLEFGNRFLLGIITSILALRYHSLRPSFVFHGSLNGFLCIASALHW